MTACFMSAVLLVCTGFPRYQMDLVHSFENDDKAFYLVREGEKQMLILVTSDLIESRTLAQSIEKKFEACGFKFRAGVEVK